MRRGKLVVIRAGQSWLTFLFAVWLSAFSLRAQTNDLAAEPPSDGEEAVGSAEGIAQQLQESEVRFRFVENFLLPRGIVEPVFRARQWLEEKANLKMSFSTHTLAFGVAGLENTEGVLGFEGALVGRWRMTSGFGYAPSWISAKLRYRQILAGEVPSELRDNSGALWGFIDGFNNNGWELPELYGEGHLFNDRMLLRYGQLAPDDLIDDHPLRSSKNFFLNQAFSSSPAVGLPSNGLGIAIRWQSDHNWDITAVASNIAASNLDDRSEWRLSSDLFEGLQVGYEFEMEEGHRTRIQLLGWNADAVERLLIPSGQGASLTISHRTPEEVIAYFRYAWASGEASVVDQFAAAGFAWHPDGGRASQIGIGLASGKSSSDEDSWQHSAEVFGKYKLGEWNLNASLQVNQGDELTGSGWAFTASIIAGLRF